MFFFSLAKDGTIFPAGPFLFPTKRPQLVQQEPLLLQHLGMELQDVHHFFLDHLALRNG